MLNESYKFEQCRINQLHEERLYIQKKTFTKWMNSFLQKVKMEVDDIFVDLADGRKLLKLFEIISGEKLGKPNNGKMRVHKIENVNKCLAFLHTKVKLESIGAEDIVDGNKTLILGLLWTIILRFQIQDIEIELDEETDRKHSSKDALLLWCQRKTKGYQHVNVADFSQSWRSGMAFNALIHSHRPELIDYNSLNPNNHIENLNNAFDVAKKNLAIQPLLDSEDIDIAKPDERSILTYVSSYYHTFAKYNSEVISGKRIANIISQLMEIDRCQLNYEMYTASLLNWIQMKIYELNNREFPNNLDGIHVEFIKFKEYRTVEKPPKYKERSEIEALLFNIQTKMKSLGQSSYIPPEGKLVQDIQKSWVNLEKAEHKRELALREEMIRLEKLNNLADSFFRKSDIRKGYLTEMITVLTDARYGTNLSQVEATVKKHEAICADILSRNERVEALSSMVIELENGNFHNIEEVKVIEQEIGQMWKKLLGLLKYHQTNLSIALKFMNSKREIETVENELNEVKNRMNIDSNVSHLRAFEEYLQSHSLMEAQILSHGDTINKLTKSANKLIVDDVVLQSNLVKKEIPKLSQCVASLNATYTQLTELALEKRKKLLDLQIFYKLLQDIDEEDTSLSEKINICQAILPGKDLIAIISIQQKHNVFEAEVKSHDNRLKKIKNQCKPFIEANHSEKYLIQSKLDALLEKWQQLNSMTNQKSKELTDATEAFQYHADANEAESWIKEKMQLAKSEDYGSDKQSAESLLQRHSRLESEITAYEHDIERLNQQSDKMINSGVENLFLLSGDPFLTHLPSESIEEDPEEPVTEAVLQQVYEEYQIDRVVVLYSYKGQDNYNVKKGEELILLEKSNKEWWKVMRDTEERKGYVPANYVKQIEPKIGQRLVSKPVTNVEKPQTKQTKSKYNRRNSKRRLSIVCTADTAEQRKNRINVDYNELVQLCKYRRELLEDSARMFRFNRECELFEVWMNGTESKMTKANNVYNEKKHQNDIGDPVNKLSQQFDNFITDLLANRSRLEDIDKMANEISSPMYLPITNKKREDVHKKWNNLNLLQKQLGKNIEGLTTIEIFNSTCDEAVERINDKLDKINNTQDIVKDLKTVQALKRRHENIVRELMPIEDTLKKINILSENVKSSYPLQKEHVAKRLIELNDLWSQLKESSINKQSVLDKMIGLQILKNSTADVMMWMKNYVRPLLQYDKEDSLLKDLANLDLMIKEHNDLLVDIKGKSNDIEDLDGLNKQLSTLVTEQETNNLAELIAEYEHVCKDWQNKDNFLKQCKNLLIFNQEADHIDTIINSNLTVLEFDHLGKNINDVAFLIKQHEAFQTKLYAQDQRIHNFGDLGEKLIQNNHYDSEKIETRRNQIFEHRKALNDKAFDRSKQLMDAKIYHEIKSDADEFLNWCHDKTKLIDDNDLKNMNNMERKFKRHQAIAAEVRANKSQLDKILKGINDVNKNSLLSFSELEQIATEIRNEWDKLIGLIENKDKMLNQAFQQIKHTKSLDIIDERILEIGKIINSTDYGVDRRSCKELIQQNKAVENEIEMIDSKLNDLKNKRQENEHLNSDTVVTNFDKLSNDLASLREPLIRHKQKLKDSYKFYEFEFDINAELQWIKEHVSLATSNSVPQNLIDAQNVIKKFENLKREVEGHENYINNIVNKGQELIEQNHFALNQIQVMIDQLKKEWQNLLLLMEKRNNTLHACLSMQQFLSECVEIEAWTSEKLNILNSGIHGKEETSVVKLLQKQKTTDLEIDTYSGLIEELNRQIDDELNEHTLSESDHKMLKSKVNDLNSQIKYLQKLTNERSLDLIELKKIHEFHREKNDFLSWISKQKQILLNDDYGKDFEHCSILQANFFDLNRLIVSNEERFNLCIEYATSLAKNDDDKSFADDIDIIKNAWNDLLGVANGKEKKFVAAIQIHRFNRDVADSYSRIKEKSSILDNQDLGRDTHSVQNLIRKHDIFMNDLVVLEAQLQILINDSVKLRADYAGENAKNIAEQSNIVVDSWSQLKEKSTIRSQILYDSEEYYMCSSMIRNLEQWASNLITEMNTLETVRDVQSSQSIKAAHERLKIEIDSKEDEFSTVVQKTNALSSKAFYPELKSSTERLLLERNELHNAWQRKNVYLDQLIDLNCFLRDIKQLDQQCKQHLNRLNSFEFGNTVEEVDSNLKKLEEFIKLFESQESKFNNVKECANKLVQKNHIESETIKARLAELLNKRAKLLTFILERKDELTDALILVQFKRDVRETELWIEEKRTQIEKERHSINSDDDIELKIKKLMKHQTFEAEINANVERIVDIQNKAKHLINKNHPSSIEIRTQHDDLLLKWNELLKLSKGMLQGFEEAKDIYEFNRNITQIESWIRDKELMIQFNDTGEDYEHCSFLLRKLDDVDTDMKVDENRILQINNLANKLTNQHKPEFFNEDKINKQKMTLNESWQQLQQKISDYRAKLACSLEIHSLNRDLDDINQRILEKDLAVANEYDGKNLPAIESMKRKHETIISDIHTIENQFKMINENEARRLITKYPDLCEKSRSKIQTIQDNLRLLNKDCKSKENKLNFSITVHKFFVLVKEVENWANDILTNKLGNVSTSVTVTEAKEDLQNHEYVKAEILARRDNHQTLKEYGISLLKQMGQENLSQDEKALQIENCILKIDELRKKLDLAWEEKQIYLNQCYERIIFNDLSKLSDSWLSTKEAYLTNEDLGTNLASIEELLKKHEIFTKSLMTQQRVTDFVKCGEELVNKQHFETTSIQAKLSETLVRRDKLLETSKIRQNKLNDSKIFFKFLRNVNEIQRWLNEKLKVAMDESYREPINLLSKRQKHAAFEAEIIANKERVDAVIIEGESLINSSHFKSEQIKAHLIEIEMLVRSLNEQATNKQLCLNHAYEALQFYRLCEDLELWIKDIEGVLNDDDHGKDLTSVKNLLKKHQQIENDIHNHNENVEQVKNKLVEFTQSNHFQKDDIEAKAQQIVHKYNSILEPMNNRREFLEEFLSFYQFKRDIEDEFVWIIEKENQMKHFDNGCTLQEIQRLVRKHKMFESEFQVRESHLSALVSKGHNLIKSSNNNSEEIKQLTYELQNKIQKLKDESSFRLLRLYDSLESQQFYTDVSEAESWLNERMPFLLSEDTGKDEESVIASMKKLEVINKDTDRFFSSTLTKLRQQSESFIDKNHFDSNIIKEKLNDLNSLFNQCVQLAERKREVLLKRKNYFSFERDADELILWIKDQLVIANSDDYGQDVDHIEKLIVHFQTAVSNINANHDRIDSIKSAAKNVENSSEKMDQILTLWNKLKDNILLREENLKNAKKVHTYNRSVDETICWIREKDSSTILDEVNLNYDDLDTIQAKIRGLEGFEQDLKAVREQVEFLYEEADKLTASFPNLNEIEQKKNTVYDIWNALLSKTDLHRSNLNQIEKIYSYLDEYQDLLSWINKMQALITADDKLATDVISAEEQINRHKEYKIEIDTREDYLKSFLANGENIISQGHFKSDEIQVRNSRITSLHQTLMYTWHLRNTLFGYNFDARQFIQNAEQVEKWIEAHFPFIEDNNFGDSLTEVEDLILKHEEFEKTIQAQADKLKSIERITQIEDYFQELLKKEHEAKLAEENQREMDRQKQLLQDEQNKILNQRKNEDESRYYENGQFYKLNKKENSTPAIQKYKDTSKSPRRISSFAFSRKSHKVKPAEDIPPPIGVHCEGFLERKQILQQDGKKATSRSWKNYYTVLCGQLLCFFKDKHSFSANVAASPPFSIHNARCLAVSEYTKKKFVFSIQLNDMTKFYFATNDDKKLADWVNKITFRASLPPAKQLISNETIEGNFQAPSSSLEPIADQKESTQGSCSSSESSLASPMHQSPHPVYTNHGDNYGTNGQTYGQLTPKTVDYSQENQYSNVPPIGSAAQATYANGNGITTDDRVDGDGLEREAHLTSKQSASIAQYDNTSSNASIYSNPSSSDKCMSLPPNISPPVNNDQSPYGSLKQPSNSSIKSFDDNTSLSGKKKNKMKSFFRRHK